MPDPTHDPVREAAERLLQNLFDKEVEDDECPICRANTADGYAANGEYLPSSPHAPDCPAEALRAALADLREPEEPVHASVASLRDTMAELIRAEIVAERAGVIRVEGDGLDVSLANHFARAALAAGPAPTPGADGAKAGDYGEPWHHANGSTGHIADRDGNVLAHVLEPWDSVRVLACVNALAGVADPKGYVEVLETALREISQSPAEDAGGYCASITAGRALAARPQPETR